MGYYYFLDIAGVILGNCYRSMKKKKKKQTNDPPIFELTFRERMKTINTECNEQVI